MDRPGAIEGLKEFYSGRKVRLYQNFLIHLITPWLRSAMARTSACALFGIVSPVTALL